MPYAIHVYKGQDFLKFSAATQATIRDDFVNKAIKEVFFGRYVPIYMLNPKPIMWSFTEIKVQGWVPVIQQNIEERLTTIFNNLLIDAEKAIEELEINRTYNTSPTPKI